MAVSKFDIESFTPMQKVSDFGGAQPASERFALPPVEVAAAAAPRAEFNLAINQAPKVGGPS